MHLCIEPYSLNSYNGFGNYHKTLHCKIEGNYNIQLYMVRGKI